MKRMQTLRAQDSLRGLRQRVVQLEREVGLMFNLRCRRIIFETRFRTDNAPKPGMGRPPPWNINPRENELSRMELAACRQQRAPPANLLLHFIAHIEVRNQRIC